MTSQVIRKTLWIKDMMVKNLKNREFGKQIEEISKVKQKKERKDKTIQVWSKRKNI